MVGSSSTSKPSLIRFQKKVVKCPEPGQKGTFLKIGHNSQVKLEEEGSQLPDPGPGPLHPAHLPSYRHLKRRVSQSRKAFPTHKLAILLIKNEAAFIQTAATYERVNSDHLFLFNRMKDKG